MTTKPLTQLPALDSEYPLTDDQVTAFQRDGFILLSGVATPDEIAAYQPIIRDAALRNSAETRKLEERDTYGKAFLQVINLWTKDEAVARFVTARRFASIAARLMGVEGVRLYHDQALFKEGGGGYTPLHTDLQFWPLDTDNAVTMWMPLVDIADEVGGMGFAVGSHRMDRLTGHGISDASEAELQTYVKEKGLAVKQMAGLKAGDVTFHYGWTIHRAPANPSPTMREVMTVIYYEDGVRLAPLSDTNRGDAADCLPGLIAGQPAASELNPKLYP